ncbi:enterochelin esterase [Streptomyces sp. KL118A]|uniref:enterochelin esterase n=1 Tax=Streptomyces sp. KL118A TaxID=3045153 RepID=UPI00278BB788|nr:enterochelin esterase [Streptomyces sp. KL118A]
MDLAAGLSPTLRTLASRVSDATEGELPALLEAFWKDVEARGGTPLIEPADGDPSHRAVTFLWRGHRATRQVLLLANRLVDRDRLADALLTPLTGTDVWHLTLRLRADHRGTYRIAADLSPGDLPTAPELRQLRLRALSAHAAHDPLNPRRIGDRWGQPDGSVFALPDAPAQPWTERRDDIPRGRVERHRLPAGVLGAGRDVWVHLPPGGPRPDSPVVVLCDGDMWFGRLALQDTLDALVADRAVPPPVVLAPDAVDRLTRWQDLTARDEYVGFLADEVLPWAAARWPLTADPARTVVAGQSLGGLTALYAGLRRPERFGAVLAQSPSLWWRPGLPHGVPKSVPAGETPWLAELFATETPRPPLRVHLDVGLHEGSMVDHSRLMYETLAAHGHTVSLREYNGGHDYACWRGGLADALVGLLGRAVAGTGR